MHAHIKNYVNMKHYESYTYSEQPKTPKPTNNEKKNAKKSTIIERRTCFFVDILKG